ncbi:hypothetical protein MHK_004225, partial [Candidatus Magnetomorum sp. HK-1]
YDNIRNCPLGFGEKSIHMRISSKEQLSQLSGTSIERLNEFASLSDLAILYGVGPVFARIIFDVGIKSVKSFINYKAEEFINIYENKTKKKADFGVNDSKKGSKKGVKKKRGQVCS